MYGGLSARPVETLLISRRVNAGKFWTCMTLLSYLLSVKWRKYEYTNVINEVLANVLLHLPYRKWWLNADLTDPVHAAEAATGVCDIDKWPPAASGRLYNECMWSAPRHPQPVLVGECLYAREISVSRLQNYRTLMTPHSTRSPSSYQHRHRVNDWQQTAVSAAQRRDNAGNVQNSAL